MFEALRVLVVEDHDDSREMLVELLGLMGVTVAIAGTVAEALRQVDVFTPDAILSDIGLPDVDGYELARSLRHHPRRQRMRLVAVTGFSHETDRKRALQAGYDVFVAKPVRPETLTEIVRSPSRALTGSGT